MAKLTANKNLRSATYYKIEKGDRRAKRDQVIVLADSLKTNSKELLRLWSADEVYEIIAEEEEEEAAQILNVVAESIVNYNRQKAKI